jgi:hypothetical protein
MAARVIHLEIIQDMIAEYAHQFTLASKVIQCGNTVLMCNCKTEVSAAIVYGVNPMDLRL